jgi:hypothetical protein
LDRFAFLIIPYRQTADLKKIVDWRKKYAMETENENDLFPSPPRAHIWLSELFGLGLLVEI